MNLHEKLDNFLGLSPRQKLGAIAVTILLIIGIISIYTFVVYRLGVNAGDSQAISRYKLSEEKRMKQIAESETRIVQLQRELDAALIREQAFANENERLKRDNELRAQNQQRNDAQNFRLFQEKQDQIKKEKEKKINEIESNTDFNSNLCALCADLSRSGEGYKLSESFCGQCKAR